MHFSYCSCEGYMHQHNLQKHSFQFHTNSKQGQILSNVFFVVVIVIFKIYLGQRAYWCREAMSKLGPSHIRALMCQKYEHIYFKDISHSLGQETQQKHGQRCPFTNGCMHKKCVGITKTHCVERHLHRKIKTFVTFL